ncbi:MAG: MFS transporter [Bacteroidales bacterium]|nr:MFS transporter [Bacteroidales bacterium]
MRKEQKEPVTHSDGLPLPERFWAILAIALGLSVSVLDVTIVNVALPTIAMEMHTSPSDVIWVVNAYQLSIILTLLSFSSLGDIFGYRKVYLFGLTLFVIASIACALSESFPTLIIARALQGFGAAALSSVNTALLRIIYPKRQLGRGMGINALVVAVSLAAGPTIASIVLSVACWNWLFAINVPIILLALYFSIRYLPHNPVKIEGRKFDILSSLTNALVFGLLIFTLDGITHKWSCYFILLGAFAFLTIGTLFVRKQLRQEHPLLPVDLMRIPIFSLSVLASSCSFSAQMLAMVSLPFFFQNTLGYDSSQIGFLLTPWPFAIMLVAPIAGRLVERLHAGILGGFGMMIFATGLFLIAFLPDHPTTFDIIWRMSICGVGFGLFQSPNSSIIVGSAPQHRSGGASGMLGTARMLGQTLGAALAAMMFTLFPANNTSASLLLASLFASIAMVVSLLRISLPTPLVPLRKKD